MAKLTENAFIDLEFKEFIPRYECEKQFYKSLEKEFADPKVLRPFVLKVEGGLSGATTDLASSNFCPTPLNDLDNIIFGSQSQNKLKLNIAQTKIDSLSVSNKSLMSKIKSLEKERNKTSESKRPAFWLYILIAVISFFGGFYLARKI